MVAFVGLNLLAQRFGALKANGGLDYYAALPVPSSVVVLATAASYATFAVPGTVVTAVAGVLMYDLAWAPLLLLPVVVLLAGASLAGVGAAIGLLAPKPEIATVTGQLGMSAVIFLDLVPAHRLPAVVQVLRAVVPSTYAADALTGAFAHHPDGWLIVRDLGVCCRAWPSPRWCWRRGLSARRSAGDASMLGWRGDSPAAAPAPVDAAGVDAADPSAGAATWPSPR